MLKIIPNPPASGFGHLSFWLVFLANLSSILARGFVMVSVIEFFQHRSFISENFAYCSYCPFAPFVPLLLLLLLPQLTLAVMSLLITTSFNLLDAFKLVAHFPAVALMPVFTPFTLGPDTFSYRRGCQQASKMRLHYGFTSLNLVLTGIGFFFCYYQKGNRGEWMISGWMKLLKF